MNRAAREQERVVLGTEVAFFALSVATAIGFCRVFVGWSFLPPMVLAAGCSHLLAGACRRRGWNVGLAALASVVALALFVTLAFYRDTSFYGLPTATTWNTLTTDLQTSWGQFSTAISPVNADAGYLVAAIGALWVAAFLADSFAFRALAALEAILPTGILFVFASALGADRLRFFSTALWLIAAAIAFALHRTMADEAGGWLAGLRRGTLSSVVRTSALLGIAAVVAGLVLGPLLPGAGEKALLDTRGPGNGTRQTISPLVDIRGRIVDRSDVEAFSVVTSDPTYWRLTALGDFDGRTWTSDRGFGDAGGRLAGGVSDSVSKPVVQDVTISALDAIWLPAAYAPARIEASVPLRYDSDTASLVVRDGNQVEPGTTYRVESEVPELTPELLQQSTAAPPPSIAREYLGLPSTKNFPNDLRKLATEIMSTGTTPYAKAVLLQNWFRENFTYDLAVPPGSSSNAIERFLRARRGYCEQFAGTYAAFARVVGLPSRVAVGFTEGALGPDGAYHVTGKYAHAWPEIYFTGIGWVPFEPTPSRGLPGAESYTGVPAAQEGQQPTATPTTVPTATTVAGGPAVSRPFNPNELVPINPLGGATFAEPTSSGPNWLLVVGIIAGVLLLLAGLWLVAVPRVVRARWDRRRRAATTGADRVLVSWHEATDVLARSGTPAQASETPLEFADRLADAGEPDGALLRAMADNATVAAYSGGDVPEEMVGATDDARRSLEHDVLSRASWRNRLLWRADPRPALRRRLPGDPAAPSEDGDDDRVLETVGRRL